MKDGMKLMDWLWLALGVLAVAVLSAVLLSGCCPCRHIKTDTRDSVRVETHTVTVERIDTQIVELPVEVYRNVTRDTASHLSGRWAESDAWIASGILHHTLTARGEVPVQVRHVTQWRDSIQYRDRMQTEVVQVERGKTKMERVQQWGFWVLLALCGLGLALSLWRRFR